MYNIFNINADTGRSDGLAYAAKNDWTTIEKCIAGSIPFLEEKYINVGQDTLYSLDWSYSEFDESGKATHQYATNVADAALKGIGIGQSAAKENQSLNEQIVFKIPVYSNMPEERPYRPVSGNKSLAK